MVNLDRLSKQYLGLLSLEKHRPEGREGGTQSQPFSICRSSQKVGVAAVSRREPFPDAGRRIAMDTLYLLLKVVHIAAVIIWLGGLLALGVITARLARS